MWQQRACYEQSNVLDVTIQCQLNVASKNFAEFSTMYATHPSHQTTTSHQTTDAPMSSAYPQRAEHTGSLAQYNTENVTPTKYGLHGDIDSLQRAYASFGAFSNSAPHDSRPACEQGNVNHKVGYTNSGFNVSPGFTPCMNDSGYCSPSFNTNRNYSAFSPTVNSVKPTIQIVRSSPTSVYQNVKCVTNEPSLDYQCNYATQHPGNHTIPSRDQDSPVSVTVDEPCEEMKIAMRERDLTQRLFALRSRDSEAASNLEAYYQSQTSVVDRERHNILCQMAYNKTSSDSINIYYNRKLLSVLEHVEEKLSVLEGSTKCKGGKRQPVPQKKSRLLPKQGVKILETWYQENLENPYPSREVTLSMASEGDITVEQIRKWFANKRNRSRNNKLKARQLGDT